MNRNFDQQWIVEPVKPTMNLEVEKWVALREKLHEDRVQFLRQELKRERDRWWHPMVVAVVLTSVATIVLVKFFQ